KSGSRRGHRPTSSCEKDRAGSRRLHRRPVRASSVRMADALARFARSMKLGDLTDYGLPLPAEGVFARYHRLGVTPAVIDPEVIDAIKAGRIEIVPGTESLDRTGARLAAGGRVEPETI